jgi:hypothetical protein
MMYRWAMIFVMTIVAGNGAPGLILGQDAASSGGQSRGIIVTGVIERLDLSANKGLLKTPVGKPVFFEIVKPELFQGITIGQRVTLQLDEHGRAIKAIESQSIPELPAPTQ